MQRCIVALAFVCLCTGSFTQAQEFKVWNQRVQVHGFFSQGFIKTDQNNWLTMHTETGSGAMTDMALNMSSQLTDKFRVGAQIYDRNLGQLGQWHPSLDWGLADYRFHNWLGVRAGKVKTTLGLYNDSQDLDFYRVFALLPQGIYPTDLRDTTIAHSGADVYGDIPLNKSAGGLSYTAYVGHRSDGIYSGYPYLISQWGVQFHSLTALQYGGDLRWFTPLKGLLVGASRLNQEFTGKGTFVDVLHPTAGSFPYETKTKANWTNQFYGQYIFRKLRLEAEYRRGYFYVPYVPGSDSSLDSRAWYVAGTYHLCKKIELGSYYSHYQVRTVTGGLAALLAPSQSDPELPQNHIYDKVLAGRFDLNRFAYLKVEGHFMDGYGIAAYPDGFYPQQNGQGFNRNTNALVLKTGFHF